MDVVVPSICLSSVAGAILFYTGGRLHARPTPPPPPQPDVEVEAERAARRRAEEESAGAQRAMRDAVSALAEERSRTNGLRDELAAARDALARAEAQATRGHAETTQLRGEAAQAHAAVAQARTAAAAARGETEQARGELSQARAGAEQVRGELGQARAEAETLRRKVRDLASRPPPPAPPPRAPAVVEEEEGPPSDALDTDLAIALQTLCKAEPGLRAAVISDERGLLVAATGARGNRVELAAAAALTLTTASRLRELLPLGEPVGLTLVDAGQVAFRTRWLPLVDGERLLLSTLGAAPPGPDVAAQALHRRLAAVLGRGG